MEKGMSRYRTNGGASVTTEIIKKGYLRNFILLLLSVFVLGTIFSALALYLDTYRPLNTHYSAIFSILTGLKETILIKTIQINIIFFLLTAAGILVIGLLYSHRVAGPLYRIKVYARSVSEGKPHGEVKFRNKDAIHSFADAVNGMTKSYEQRLAVLDSMLQDLESALKKIRTLQESGGNTEAEVKRALEIDRGIKSILGNIKF